MNSPHAAPTYSIRLYPENEIVARRLRRSEAEGFVQRFNRLMNEESAYAEMIEETNESRLASTPAAPR